MERRCILKEMIELRRAIRALMREARATVATFSDGKCHSHAAGRSVIRITSISICSAILLIEGSALANNRGGHHRAAATFNT